uniref:Uncharacterized protein n=1 Tax=Anguilla anguilla TaxID=7936 RepID=A0A0E9WYD4_ANGAN
MSCLVKYVLHKTQVHCVLAFLEEIPAASLRWILAGISFFSSWIPSGIW